MLNLDTHILIFAINGDLRPSEQALLAQSRWSISAIVLWELAKLIQLGRVDNDSCVIAKRSSPGAVRRSTSNE